MSDSEKGHVQFSVDSGTEHTNVIVYRILDQHNIEAHVGFLQLNHQYEINLSLPASAGHQYEAVRQPSLAVKDISIETAENDESQTLKVDFFAHKQRLLKEKVSLTSSSAPTVTITICARVLGPGQGTPMLRKGVKLTGVVPVEESEVSDWQGFD